MWVNALPTGWYDDRSISERWYGWPMFYLHTWEGHPGLLRDGTYWGGTEGYELYWDGLIVNCIVTLLSVVIVGIAIERRIWARLCRTATLVSMLLWLGLCTWVNATTIREYTDWPYADRGYGWPSELAVRRLTTAEVPQHDNFEIVWGGLFLNMFLAIAFTAVVGLTVERKVWSRLFCHGQSGLKTTRPQGNELASGDSAGGAARHENGSSGVEDRLDV